MPQGGTADRTSASGSPGAPTGTPLQLRLLGGFELLRDGVPADVAPQGQRVLAMLALRRQPLARRQLATNLWLDAGDDQALACLRTALWRLNRDGPVVVSGPSGQVQLRPGTQVDADALLARARRLADPHGPLEPGDDDTLALREELLPGWPDDWVVAEREWLRQLQLHGLERLAARLLAAGQVTQALEAGLAAVACEPLRESAQRVVITVHLAEGNHSEALRQYLGYQRLLRDALGIMPSPRLQRLLWPSRDDTVTEG